MKSLLHVAGIEDLVILCVCVCMCAYSFTHTAVIKAVVRLLL